MKVFLLDQLKKLKLQLGMLPLIWNFEMVTVGTNLDLYCVLLLMKDINQMFNNYYKNTVIFRIYNIYSNAHVFNKSFF